MSFFNTFAPKQNFSSNTLRKEDDWKLTKYGSQSLLGKLSRTKHFIGTSSAFGKVERLSYDGNEHLFVLKKINFSKNNANRAHIFETEVNVGSKNNIGKVGPRVLAYRFTPFGGEYVMDNVEMGHANAMVAPLSQVKGQLTPEFWKAIQKVILNFHLITRGQHGDLHGDNILIIQVGKQHYIRIIDYGAFRKFDKLKNKGTPVKKHYGLNVYNLGKGQKFIHNKNFFNLLKNKSGKL
jgi:hypothetical protein